MVKEPLDYRNAGFRGNLQKLSVTNAGMIEMPVAADDRESIGEVLPQFGSLSSVCMENNFPNRDPRVQTELQHILSNHNLVGMLNARENQVLLGLCHVS